MGLVVYYQKWERIKIISNNNSLVGLDSNHNEVGGSVVDYTLGSEPEQSIRVECDRTPANCPALQGGQCIANNYDINSGDPEKVGDKIGCGKLEENQRVASAITL